MEAAVKVTAVNFLVSPKTFSGDWKMAFSMNEWFKSKGKSPTVNVKVPDADLGEDKFTKFTLAGIPDEYSREGLARLAADKDKNPEIKVKRDTLETPLGVTMSQRALFLGRDVGEMLMLVGQEEGQEPTAKPKNTPTNRLTQEEAPPPAANGEKSQKEPEKGKKAAHPA